MNRSTTERISFMTDEGSEKRHGKAALSACSAVNTSTAIALSGKSSLRDREHGSQRIPPSTGLKFQREATTSLSWPFSLWHLLQLPRERPTQRRSCFAL